MSIGVVGEGLRAAVCRGCESAELGEEREMFRGRLAEDTFIHMRRRN
jgi:hypothetical protein